MAQPVVLTAIERAPRLALDENIHNNLFPYDVSAVFSENLSEAEPRLEGLDLFFFFDKFWL